MRVGFQGGHTPDERRIFLFCGCQIKSSFVQIDKGEVLSSSDKATFYVRDSRDSDHVKVFISQDLPELTIDQPAVEIDLALYEKNDQRYPRTSETVEQFIDSLVQGSKQKGLIEGVFITSAGLIEIRKASNCSWTDAMPVIETALEQLIGGDQINFMPFVNAPMDALVGAHA